MQKALHIHVMPEGTSRNIFGNDTTPSFYIYIYVHLYIHTYIYIYHYISILCIYVYTYIYICHHTSIVYIICQLSYGARNVLQSKKNSQLVSCQRTLPGPTSQRFPTQVDGTGGMLVFWRTVPSSEGSCGLFFEAKILPETNSKRP